MKDTMENSKQQHAFIKEGNVRFTPAMAAVVIRDHAYENNRDVGRTPKHVAVLAETMRRGAWLPKDQLCFALVGDKLVLINGHHRMHAQVDAAVDIEWAITIYECRDDAEVAALYARFDTNIKKRTDENILGSFGLAGEEGLNNTTARGLWRAVPMIANNLQSGAPQLEDNFFIRHIAEDRLKLAREYAPEAREYEKAIANARGKIRKKLLNGSVMAVGLVTLRSHLSTAYRFWQGIADNDGLRRGDPRATLCAYFLEAETKRGSNNELIFLAAKAWNYYVEDRNLLMLKATGKPVNVAGTSYWVSP